MNSQVFGCPNCSQPFRVLAEQAGQVIQCPSCAQTVAIPDDAFQGTRATTSSGETSSGETSSGETSSGETSSGETSSGETSSGETSSGETSSGETSSGETSTGETSTGETSTGETPSGETSPTSLPARAAPLPESPEAQQQIFACVHCQGQFGITPDMYGFQVACPHCQQTLEIQDPTASEPESPKIEINTGSRNSAKSKSKKLPIQETPLQTTSENAELFAPGFPANTSTAKKKRETKKPAPKKPSTQPNTPALSGTTSPKANEDIRPDEKSRLNPRRRTTNESKSSNPAENPTDRSGSNQEVATEAEAESKADPNQFVPESVAHLLPPTFDVFDPTQIRIKSKDEHTIAVPDGKGGAKQLDQRVLRVEHQGEKVTLVAMSARQKFRRRLISNVLAILIGIGVLALAFKILT